MNTNVRHKRIFYWKSLSGIGGHKLLNVISNAMKNEQMPTSRDAFLIY